MSSPAQSRQYYPAVGAALVTVVVWASAFPLIRIALDGLSPLGLAAARFWLAGALAAAWLVAVRPPLPSRRDIGIFMLCGLIGIALYNAFLNTGQKTVSSGAASFLINTGPIITAFLATLFLGERLGTVGWIGSAVAFAGAATIAAGQPGGLHLGAGASLVLTAALCQATYFTLQRPLVPRYGALVCTAYTIIAGALLLTPWLPEAGRSLAQAGTGSAVVYALAALVILPSIIGYAAWTYALGTLGAARAANFLYLVPPVATSVSYVLTGEVPGWRTIIGGVVAIAGVAIRQSSIEAGLDAATAQMHHGAGTSPRRRDMGWISGGAAQQSSPMHRRRLIAVPNMLAYSARSFSRLGVTHPRWLAAARSTRVRPRSSTRVPSPAL